MLILADHLDVPSSTLCLTAFICCVWELLVTAKTSWISSKISGLLRSRIFMRSFSTMMMFCVRSSAPCLELFSAAPAVADVPGLGVQLLASNPPTQAGHQSALLLAKPRPLRLLWIGYAHEVLLIWNLLPSQRISLEIQTPESPPQAFPWQSYPEFSAH